VHWQRLDGGWDKLQYPFVQYQRLKTIDTLSQVPGVIGDARFNRLLDELCAFCAAPDGACSTRRGPPGFA
jgi:hypothetical protein